MSEKRATEEKPIYMRPDRIAALYAVTVNTVRNWIVKGVPKRGRTVKLRAIRVGRMWRIPCEAWEEFLEALNGAPVVTAESAAERRREDEEAGKRLDEWLGPVRDKRMAKKV